MNVAMLEAVKQVGSVKRVVITSSMVAIRDSDGPRERKASGDDRIPTPTVPFRDQRERYAASKIAALRAIDDFVSWNPDLHFEVVNIMPGFVVGRQELATSSKDFLTSSNRALLLPVVGGTVSYTGTRTYISPTAHLSDVVDLHLFCLGSEYLEGKKEWNFAIAGTMGDGGFKSIPEIARALFPDAFIDGRLRQAQDERGRDTGKGKVLVYDVDREGAEIVLGRKMKGVEQQVKDVVGQYLELLSKE